MSNPNNRSWTIEEIKDLEEIFLDRYPDSKPSLLNDFMDFIEESIPPESTKEEYQKMLKGLGLAANALRPKSSSTEVPEECVVCFKTKEEHEKRTTDGHAFMIEEDLKDMNRAIQ